MSHQFGAGEEFYHGYSVDDEDQPQGFGESLADDRGLDEPLDEGYSPPDRWSTGQGFGNTAFEAEVGETLAQRLAQEEPEPDPYAWRLDDGQPEGRRVGGFRAGHLLAYDPGSGENIIERVPHSDASDAANFSFMAGQEPYWGRQVGDRRAGRLVSFDTDSGELTRDYLFAQPPPVPCGLLRTMQNERLTPSIPRKRPSSCRNNGSTAARPVRRRTPVHLTDGRLR